ncbi:TetR/AcrR family transcriptional regulator [Plantactinospora endophytica]|uniref:TetR family transcriptional regulator n=1 Tax=Plantactinospora endophytica TaxID=673535 RepID=A0ABQ4DZ27_9ACTN|nr:TetR/AcrR family transcriptional regulator [Plantactinospora endophytica]GIG87712.1 TetR family transcriptional regulator [Plantactinospora endophytica]
MTSFRRARSEEQRAERRRDILETAAAMLDELPVAKISLNELSRRVCLAKSNVLRYFESREAVLLELLDAKIREWLGQLGAELDNGIDAAATAQQRADRLAAVLSASCAARPVLCDLMGNQAAVLEHNISTRVAADYKRAAIEHVQVLARHMRTYVPEFGEHDAERFAAATMLLVGATWTHSRPAPAMRMVYEEHPELAVLRIEFADVLRQLLEVLASGLLSRQGPSTIR